MSSVGDNKQRILLESKLRHLEEYIKGLEAFCDGYLMFDRMMREAVRVDHTGFQSATEYLHYVCRSVQGIPRPPAAPDLPSVLADLDLVDASELESLYAKCSAEEMAVYKRLSQIPAIAQDRELAAIKAEVGGLPSPWLVDPKLAPHLMEKLNAIEEKVGAYQNRLESQVEEIIEEFRDVVESMEDPGVSIQPVNEILERAQQHRVVLIDLLSVGACSNVPEVVPETKSRKGRGEWPETRTQPAVAQYLREHAGLYNELVPLVLLGDPKASKKFKAHFGATAISRAITKKSDGGTGDPRWKSQVQKTAAYRAAVPPLLKKPPQRPLGWESPEENAALGDYLRDMLSE